MLLGVIFNGLGVYVFGYLAHKIDMWAASAIILSLNIILNAVIGYFIFKDHLHPMQWLWIVSCISGIILVYAYEQ